MKKMICIVLALLSCLFAGCVNSNDAMGGAAPRNVACVVTIANNNPKVDARMIDELSGLPGLPGSTYAVINAEGQPRVACEGEIPDFSDRGYSNAMLERIQASVSADISGQIDAAAPWTAEVDIASAAALAVRTLRAHEAEDRENLLVFYCSGISSSGLIDMTAVPVYQMDVDASVGTLIDDLNLDLSGIDVAFYACGDVAGEQPALSLSEQAKLKEFYQKLFCGMGADSVTFMADVPSGEGYDFDQKVSVMKTEGTGSGLQPCVVDYQEMDAADDPFGNGEVLSFDEKSIKFHSDSTELADPDAAREVLGYVVQYMLDHPGFELLICGTTTSAGEEASCMAFSEARARAVQELLVSEGVDRDRVHVVGCGYSSVLYIPDRLADGTLDGSVAPQNRSVKLVGCDSDAAAQILQSLKAS